MNRWAWSAAVLVTAGAVTVGGTGVWSGVSQAGPTPTPHDREHLAASILDHWARSPMTASSLRADGGAVPDQCSQ